MTSLEIEAEIRRLRRILADLPACQSYDAQAEDLRRHVRILEDQHRQAILAEEAARVAKFDWSWDL